MVLFVKDLIPIPAIIVIFTCTLLASIVGNIYIILSITSSNYMKSVTNIFIGSKSVSDLMAGCFMSMFTLLQNIEPYRTRGRTCEPPVFVEMTCVSASIFSILAVGVDRYLAVLHPTLKYFTPKKATLLVVAIWITSAFYSLRLIVQFRDTKTDVCKMFFDEKENEVLYRTIDLFCLFLFPMVIMTCMYYRIGTFLWEKSGVTSAVLRKRKVVMFLIVSLVLFCISWGPFYVLDINHFLFIPSSQISEEDKSEVYIILRFVFVVMAICNGFLTPLAYVTYFPHIRLETKKAIAMALGLRDRVTSASPWSKIVCKADALSNNDIPFTEAKLPVIYNSYGENFSQTPCAPTSKITYNGRMKHQPNSSSRTSVLAPPPGRTARIMPLSLPSPIPTCSFFPDG